MAESETSEPVVESDLVPSGAWIGIVGAVGWDESNERWPQLEAAVEEAARQAIERYKRSAQPVVDSELRDRIAEAGIAKFREYTGTPSGQNMWNVDIEKTFRLVADEQASVVAHAVRQAYIDGHDAGYAAANAGDPWHEQEEAAEALPAWERELLESERLRDRIRTWITEQAPVWEESFDAGPGTVCSVSDAAVVVSRELAQRNKAYGRASLTIGQLRAELALVRAKAHDAVLDAMSGPGGRTIADRLAAKLVAAESEADKLRAQVKLLANACQRQAYTDKDVAQLRADLEDAQAEVEYAAQRASERFTAHDAEVNRLKDMVLKAHIETAKARGKLPCPYGSDQCTTVDGHWYHGDCSRSAGPVTEASEQAEPRKSCPECSAQPWRPHREDCPVVLHEQEMREIADQSVCPATPAEPRVWRSSDTKNPPPPDVTAVRRPNGSVYHRVDASGKQWKFDTNKPLPWTELVRRLADDEVLPEVVWDQSGGEPPATNPDSA